MLGNHPKIVMNPDEFDRSKRRKSLHLCTDHDVEAPTSSEIPSEKTVNVKLDEVEEEMEDQTFYTWTREHFSIPVCQNFIPDSGSKRKDACKCGSTKSEHKKIKDEFSEETEWSAKEHCKLVPTTSFGTLSFINEDSVIMPKFIRVGTTITEPDPQYIIPEKNLEPLKSLLLEHWKLNTPGLLISVIGK